MASSLGRLPSHLASSVWFKRGLYGTMAATELRYRLNLKLALSWILPYHEECEYV
ncbi:hypothetical protein QWZ16_23210 [Vibrio ostreicida]|uniref:Uncharacterized protein n=1 Tax=Vibrio ostreicida TaxID=526588 RepID=A0ABT8BZI4_9VIBR|nr:hypothetical protein [Vibrio ostreicida]MDN3612511.1 hypothetical protein [Vibrio ostreicida]